MTTLYLAWQHPPSRQWFPIGRLVRNESAGMEFEFTYVQGAKEAERSVKFKPIPEFPVLDRRYRAPALFPTFRNRVMNTSRDDRAEYLRQLGLDVNGCDELAELSVSGGRSTTDSFEIFPAIETGRRREVRDSVDAARASTHQRSCGRGGREATGWGRTRCLVGTNKPSDDVRPPRALAGLLHARLAAQILCRSGARVLYLARAARQAHGRACAPQRAAKPSAARECRWSPATRHQSNA